MKVFLPIATYIINLKNRQERKEHISKEFEGRDEFKINIVEACEHESGAMGLWNSITHILQNLVQEDDDFIILCEDDHQFTEHYSREYLYQCIGEAREKNADILSGGVSWFRDTVQISENLFWVEKFSGLQFTVVFKQFYQTILEASFGNDDVADYKISALSNNKLLIYPFISTQKDFGYSDVTVKNNKGGRVTELFSKSSESLRHLKHVSLLCKTRQENGYVANEEDPFDNITIPTYVVNLPERTERLAHIKSQFAGRGEFDVTIAEACKHPIGAVGLWHSIRKIIELAIKKDDDVIIICEDDHEFTKHYSKEFLLKNIIEAYREGVAILSGGIGNFVHALPITENRFWINSFWSTQFLVLYKNIFQQILNEPFDNNVAADDLLSEITSNKMVLFPFISVQKDFGYSDINVNLINKDPYIFEKALNRMKEIKRVVSQYSSSSTNKTGVILNL